MKLYIFRANARVVHDQVDLSNYVTIRDGELLQQNIVELTEIVAANSRVNALATFNYYALVMTARELRLAGINIKPSQFIEFTMAGMNFKEINEGTTLEEVIADTKYDADSLVYHQDLDIDVELKDFFKLVYKN